MGTKPEIYAMGLRNPFRFSVDQKTGWVYLADYGPDADAADPGRGSDGRVEWNLIKAARQLWLAVLPRRRGLQRLRLRHRPRPAPKFDCAQPVNNSPNNTGLTNLPPVVEPTLWYGRGVGHPELGRGGAPMGGPRYVFDPAVAVRRASGRRTSRAPRSSTSGARTGSTSSISTSRASCSTRRRC